MKRYNERQSHCQDGHRVVYSTQTIPVCHNSIIYNLSCNNNSLSGYTIGKLFKNQPAITTKAMDQLKQQLYNRTCFLLPAIKTLVTVFSTILVSQRWHIILGETIAERLDSVIGITTLDYTLLNILQIFKSILPNKGKERNNNDQLFTRNTETQFCSTKIFLFLG